MTDGAEPTDVHVVFDLPQDEDGWPPARSERLWAIPVTPGQVMLDSIPFFVRGSALGDVVVTEVDAEGVVWVTETVEFSGNCTIRVIPFAEGELADDRQAVLDAFAPLGVEGEGIEQFGLVALNVPPSADVAGAKRLLLRGQADGWWDYEEGCVTEAWQALDPA
ncbi:DUF4265 domain-containing protein [Planotetraspora sp. A-T 1434]|uniref:DUF4265 domain-containing protein n=1 Tax=Planotetraspora sp. A-T 1434 TaxID=2979219 RepID=UPI0021C156B0|nr:DUF4265 domain-containing protein [Planotetraspora sp. A-T 1434]MCT9928969.1 DUF4265 domain-containing protein [Planotetraspora sp. A-T 1434]